MQQTFFVFDIDDVTRGEARKFSVKLPKNFRKCTGYVVTINKKMRKLGAAHISLQFNGTRDFPVYGEICGAELSEVLREAYPITEIDVCTEENQRIDGVLFDRAKFDDGLYPIKYKLVLRCQVEDGQ